MLLLATKIFISRPCKKKWCEDSFLIIHRGNGWRRYREARPLESRQPMWAGREVVWGDWEVWGLRLGEACVSPEFLSFWRQAEDRPSPPDFLPSTLPISMLEVKTSESPSAAASRNGAVSTSGLTRCAHGGQGWGPQSPERPWKRQVASVASEGSWAAMNSGGPYADGCWICR